MTFLVDIWAAGIGLGLQVSRRHINLLFSVSFLSKVSWMSIIIIIIALETWDKMKHVKHFFIGLHLSIITLF